MTARFSEPDPWLYRHSRTVLTVLSVMGAVLTAYLTISKFQATEVALCSGEGMSCDLVLGSRWAMFLGLPTALWGLLAYLGVLALAVVPQSLPLVKQWRWPVLFGLTTAMAAFEVYMLYLMVGVLKSFCLYCTVSIVLVAAIWVTTLIGRNWIDLGQLLFNGTIISLCTLVFTVGVYANQTPPPSPLAVNLAAHLEEVGGTMYGAHWCPACAQQKEYFGSAFKDVPYVECSPNGDRGTPPAQECIDKGVQRYPTWFIDGEPTPGVFPLEDLAQMTGYQFTEADLAS
ncbi:MAG: vitamin K epoxide reductase family protein [Cyanobacteria bacterium J06639_1]